MNGIRLQPRDLDIIKSLADFNGLPLPEVVSKYFSGSKYGYRRLKQLEDNGYVDKTHYYYARKKEDRMIAQRVAAICYATPKGLREIEYTIDPRFVVPNEDRLDVTNLVGKLFSQIPNLISKRQAIEQYGLKNFMPISCVVPSDPPIFIYVLGNVLAYQEIGRIVGFMKSGIIPDARHIVVSRIFNERFYLPNAYFIPWTLAPEYLPNIAKDHDYYLNEFLKIVKKYFPGIKPLTPPDPLIKAEYQGKILHIGELVSGSNLLRLILQNPPEGTFIYAPSRRHFHGVQLKQGSFLFYSKQDQNTFEMLLRDKNMYSIPYKIRR